MTDALLDGASLREAIEAIERGRKGIAVVVEENGKLAGVVTDGDIRRAILAGQNLESGISGTMNRRPLRAEVGTSDQYLKQLLVENGLEAMPLVNADGLYVEAVHIRDLETPSQPTSSHAGGVKAAVIMAGGEGQRLRPLTQEIPKPMLDVGGMPLIERLVRSLAKAGITRIFISTNYLAHVIETHMKDGSEFGVHIEFLREQKSLGTAGALSLMPEDAPTPLLVLNGDVLTGSDYGNMALYHDDHEADLTVAAVQYRVEVPYGVLRADGARAVALEEKPSQHCLCNAGIYLLSRDCLSLIPRDTVFNMTDLIQAAIETQRKVCIFPLHEYWADIGSPSDLARVREDVKTMSLDSIA